MTRNDMLALELHMAAAYRREARARSKNPQLAAMLERWAAEAEVRAEAIRSGPLFELMTVTTKRKAA